jgi:regulator of sirC expression with transglutaminase-like and TPR domain
MGLHDSEINKKEIEALVKLLEDPDQEISRQIEARLLYFGDGVIEYLESAWEKSFDIALQQKLEEVIHKIQFERVKMDLSIWNLSGAQDLLEGVLIINRYQYPDLKKEKIIHEFEELKREAWLHFGYEMSPLEKVNVLNHVLYQVKGFSGNTANHQDPQNSYLNLVLETRKGNQLSLAIIYSIVAQSIGVPIYGVNLPQHFILAYLNQDRTEPEFVMAKNILFYINAFNRGFVFNKNDVDFFLKQLDQTPQDEYFYPCSNKAIVIRLVHNLISSYEKLGYESKVLELRELLGEFD